jgi:hypothetical protein
MDRVTCSGRGAGAVAVVVALVFSLAGASSALASGWSVQRSPIPRGASSSLLSGVSCGSAKACVAIGSDVTSTVESALAERWNGRGWSIQQTPAEPDYLLFAVSCPSATVCMAVGGGGSGNLEERWNGNTWSASTYDLGVPPAAVSCASSANCTAVGASYCGYECGSHPIAAGAVAARWNGLSWSHGSIPAPRPSSQVSDPYLAGVSCPTSVACFIAGYGYKNTGLRNAIGVPLAWRWNGRRWLFQSMPGRGSLSSIACWSATGCVAVGTYGFDLFMQPPTEGPPLIEGWNGKRWSIEPLPTRASRRNGRLAGVACASREARTAVGSDSSGTFAERWNGTKWSRQQTGRPIGATSTRLDGVSCPSPTTCIAVGSYTDTTAQQRVLLERWASTR